MSSIQEVRFASRELMPHLHCFFPDGVAEIVRDYLQGTPPPVDAATWEIARRAFRGDGAIAGIVQEYNLGSSILYLEVAEGVQSRDADGFWERFSRQFSSIFPSAPVDPGNRCHTCYYVIDRIKMVFRYHMDSSNPVRQDNIDRTMDFVVTAHRILTIMVGLSRMHSSGQNPRDLYPAGCEVIFRNSVKKSINEVIGLALKPLADAVGFSVERLLSLPPVQREQHFRAHQGMWRVLRTTPYDENDFCSLM